MVAPFRLQAIGQWSPVQIAGYDNVAVSMLSVFQCMTLNGWVNSMYR